MEDTSDRLSCGANSSNCTSYKPNHRVAVWYVNERDGKMTGIEGAIHVRWGLGFRCSELGGVTCQGMYWGEFALAPVTAHFLAST